MPKNRRGLIKPRKIHGNWRAGWALDVHTLSSRPLPDGVYDTERTELGKLVYQLKYGKDRTKIQPISEIAAKFVVLLVDDLYDSGTTVTETTKVLYKQARVQHVLVLTLTRTRTGSN